MKFRKGFTLIELLIVVAIIAILAAIAVPNFLEAQVRAKVSRCKNEMRALATGMEAYKLDANHYPPDHLFYGNGAIGGAAVQWLPLFRLSTPVAYVSSIPSDMFVNTRNLSGNDAFRFSQLGFSGEQTYASRWGQPFKAIRSDIPAGPVHVYVAAWGKEIGKIWAIASVGPDRWDNAGTWYPFGGEEFVNVIPGVLGVHHGAIYDPTNGSISDGDIVRSGP